MPHWKDEEKYYKDAKLEGRDDKGKKVIESLPRNEPIAKHITRNG